MHRLSWLTRLRIPGGALLLAGALAACSPGGDFDDRGDDDTDFDVDPGDDTDEDPDTDYEGPHFWRLDGTLVLSENTVALDGTRIQLEFTDRSGQPWSPEDLEPAPCTFVPSLTSDGPTERLDDEPLLGWWQLDLIDPADDGDGCAWPVPRPAGALETEQIPLVLGLGPFDSRLSPSLQAAGYSAGLDLYSLYLLHPSARGDLVYVFGVAGTEAQFAGEQTTVDAVPIPDGDYQLQTLVLLPVPEASEPR